MPISAPDNGVVTSYALTKGWHCSQCGRLSCRYALREVHYTLYDNHLYQGQMGEI